jgi:hypothetical protein
MPRLHAIALATTIASLGGTSFLTAQSQAELKSRKEHKLAEKFLQKADWFTDYDAARSSASKSDKLIFSYSTRSYAP